MSGLDVGLGIMSIVTYSCLLPGRYQTVAKENEQKYTQ